MTAPSTLQLMLEARTEAKLDEERAIRARREIDAKILALVHQQGKAIDEGSITIKEGDHKLSITYGIDRKVDGEILERDWGLLTAEQQAAFRFKVEVQAAAWKALPQWARSALVAIVTSKPSSPSIKVETIKKD